MPYGLAFCQQLSLIAQVEAEREILHKFKLEQKKYHNNNDNNIYSEIGEGYYNENVHLDECDECEDDEEEEEEDESFEDNNDEESDNNYTQRSSPTSFKKRKFIKLSEEDLEENWYAILNLTQEEDADEEQIKAAYRRRCLETHPDKQNNHSDELFKKVQKAFDILSDAETRLSYDSSRPFDDSIPPDVKIKEEEFYDTFAPVFARNKKWSVDKNLPSLGNDRTSFKDVLCFYDKWMTYQTWRDFSHLVDLTEIHDDMCREEKRFYMRENERLISQRRKEELKRIRLLVERARKNDPRIERKKKEMEAKRIKEQQEREAFRENLRKKQEEERAATEAEEKRRREEEVRKKQEIKESINNALRNVIDFFKTHKLLDETPANKLFDNVVRKINITWLFSKINGKEEAEQVATTITTSSTDIVTDREIERDVYDKEILGKKWFDISWEKYKKEVEAREDNKHIPAVYIINCLILAYERVIGINRYGEALKRVDETDTNEITTLANKCNSKSNLCSSSNKGDSSKSKNCKQAVSEWTEEDLSRLQKATAKFPAGTVERWSKVCVLLRHKFTEEEAMAKVNEINAALQSASHHGGDNKKNTFTSVHTSSSNKLSTDEVKTDSNVSSIDVKQSVLVGQSVDDWTIKQQKQLENGLRELKEYKEKDKFQKIAKMVDGKTAKECFERFKYLCTMNKKK